MKVQSFHALYEDNSLMHRATGEDFSKYVDHIGEDGMLERSQHLRERQYPHLSPLVDELIRQNPQMTGTIRQRLERLRTGEAQVVITGQQTGIFGGPLYAIYKLLTCLKVAKQAENQLGLPVVPIFWLATEDHDFDEINHIYAPTTEYQPRKLTVSPQDTIQRSVSRMTLDQKAVKQVLRQALSVDQETQNTKELVLLVERLIDQETTYGGFFSALLGELVNHDVIFFDADAKAVRELEIPFFEQLIQDNKEIRQALSIGIQQTTDLPDTFLNEEAAHLFVEDIGRDLLYPGEDFVTKQGKTYTELELLALLYASPERFSNSVVTRPLMQDYLFPTLAYIGGPGEIAYWTRLRPLFHHFDWTMPLLIPRMGAVMLRARDEKLLRRYDLSLEQVLSHGVAIEPFDATKINSQLHSSHILGTALIQEIEQVERATSKNLSATKKLNKQIQLAIDTLVTQERRNYDRLMRTKRSLQYQLLPNGAPQERMHSILPWLNRYGLDLIQNLRVQYEQTDAEQLEILL
ncbi:bacillithiol biosynthesis cysteine-adding enzyme BshC [Exiguobacterium sp. s127]|uniref:bacillithiol biosynthesis cysteine-adding enzyme BshC n=1 Tax=Exiguobacterium sp. s127 TaxID=2751210 RepID=UPI001BE52A6E|nr:bacillithiol biosynthesis cysteine-adding enzyme BshC [Exiguobacterium sp. s127]